ncbi:MAG: hypothetical protein H7323_00980 [Frankiales bacterium]|nr:hypothetical protein [Frankiales bacterium]
MSDVPVVTVFDPRGGDRPDVLGPDDDRDPRWSRRTRAVVAVLAVAGLLIAVALPRVTAARERQAAFDALNEVHLRVGVPAIAGSQGQLLVQFLLDDDGRRPPEERLIGARLDGDGVQAVDPDTRPAYNVLPTELSVAGRVDCSAVGQGNFPTGVALVTTALPASKVERDSRTPIVPSEIRRASLEACDLPDPDARPLVEVQAGESGLLLLNLEAVPRADDGLVLERVDVLGFTVAPADGLVLPQTLPPNAGGFYGFTVKVADCALARDERDVRVQLQVDGVRETRIASPDTSQPQPGGEPVTALLDRLLAAAC